MTVKVNPDHPQNEIILRLDQELSLVKISCNSVHDFLRREAARRETKLQTDLPDRITNALAEVV